MTWDMFFMVYGIVAIVVMVALWVLAARGLPRNDDEFGHEVVLTSLFWLPALVLVLLAWGWLTLDEVLTAEDDQ